jgi:peptidyl-prolyl cis-trans isomerase B (cyclophilin B)
VARTDKRARQKERSRQAREAREAVLRRQRRKSVAIRIGVAIAIVAVIIGITSLIRGGDDDNNPNAADTTTTPTTAPASLPAGCTDATPPDNPNRPQSFPSAPPMSIDPAKTYAAKLTTSCGDITIALDATNAPTSVNNFVFLARQGFYDGLQWPRAAKDFVIQTGGPDNTTASDAGYSVPAELPPGGAFPSGAVAWAKGDNDPAGTAGSQFFILTGDGSGLRPEYGYLGTVTAGLENAQKIASLAPPDTGDGPPTIPMYVDKVEITES